MFGKTSLASSLILRSPCRAYWTQACRLHDLCLPVVQSYHHVISSCVFICAVPSSSLVWPSVIGGRGLTLGHCCMRFAPNNDALLLARPWITAHAAAAAAAAAATITPDRLITGSPAGRRACLCLVGMQCSVSDVFCRRRSSCSQCFRRARWKHRRRSATNSQVRSDLDTPYFVIRPHRNITYVHAACCYRPSSVVCLSVCPSVTLVSPAKRLNRSRCHLGNGLGWAQLSMY